MFVIFHLIFICYWLFHCSAFEKRSASKL
jgi:hypothetical protein